MKNKWVAGLAVASGIGIVSLAQGIQILANDGSEPIIIASEEGNQEPETIQTDGLDNNESEYEDVDQNNNENIQNQKDDVQQEEQFFAKEDQSEETIDESKLLESQEPVVSPNEVVDDLKSAGAGSAQYIKDGEYFIASSLNSDKVLDVNGGSKSNGGNVQIYENNGTNAQIWKVVYDKKGGYYSLTNKGSGKVLDVNAGFAQNSNNIQQYAWNGTNAQKWHIVPTTAGYKLVSAINPNYVLDLSGANTRNGTNIQIYQNNNTKAQSWIFQELINEVAYLDKLASQNKNTLENGIYLIRNTGTGKYLTVSNSSNSNGANIDVTSTSNQETQKWKVEHDSIGYVTLINMNSGRVLDISGASKVNGTNIQQYDSNNTRAQKWITIKNGGALQLISALSSTLRMSVNGSNVDSEKNKGTSASQAWVFTKTTSIREEASNLASKNKGTVADGYYEFHSAINDKLVFDIAGAETKKGANLQIYTSNGTNAQRFKIITDALGFSSILNVHAKKYISVAGSASNFTNLSISDDNSNSWNEKWIFQKNADGTIKIMSAMNTNYVIDILSGLGKSGQNVQLYTWNGTNAQKFNLKKLNISDSSVQFSNSNYVSKWVHAHQNNYTVGREGNKITHITIHHMDGVSSAENCGHVFQNPNREASAHYGIGKNGEICQYVDEKNTAWANGNWNSNLHSVSIENSDGSYPTGHSLTTQTMNSLIRLVADIAARNVLGRLEYGKNVNVHGDVGNTACPGPYIRNNLSYIISSANKINGY
ncbi:RICIN domain-containing protein [Dubosiella newyorkensis]|uniref:RICIN domain-containing protein n=1 Tax=Dubosiella newyorkensis TaxID=1862672 RepID=UPI0032B20DF6